MADLISMRECARQLGVQLRSVQVALQSGRIHAEKTEQAGTKTRIFFDIDKVRQEWSTNTGTRNRDTRGEMTGTAPAPGAAGPPAGKAGPAEQTTYQKARGAREVYSAKMIELKYKLESKALVPVEDVKKIFFDIGKTIQLSMLNIPNRVAALIAAETNEKKVYDLLQAEINLALESLSNGKLDRLTQ